VSPETKKAQPIAVDRLGWVVVCGGKKIPPASFLYVVDLTSFLFPGFGSKDVAEHCLKGACSSKFDI
jgi:hypothetical protein